MAIQVTCPGCHKRFKVSDKWAGKTGPCPQCKAVITIPKQDEGVVVHAPTPSGPTDSKGRQVLKPISRKETKFNPVMAGAIGAGVVVCLIVAVILRFVEGGPPLALLFAGAFLLGPPLCFAAYAFLRDDELEPYVGLALWGRAAACGAVYAVLWVVYALIPWYLEFTKDEAMTIYYVVAFAPIAFGVGAFASHASLDIELGTGAIHYGFYLIITLTLAFVMGVDLVNFSPEKPPNQAAEPNGQQPPAVAPSDAPP